MAEKRVVELQEQGDLFILTMVNEENRFNPTLVKQLNEALEVVERSNGPKALILTSKGKFFSNGLDLNFMGNQRDQIPHLILSIWKLLDRLMVIGVPTVAAINGHAFGAGLFLALACDHRVMRLDRGFLCFPEVDLGMPLSGFKELAKAKLSIDVVRTGVLTGKKWNSKEAAEVKMVDLIVPESELLPSAIKWATELLPRGENRSNFSALKQEIFERCHELYSNATITSWGLSKL